MGDFKDLLLWKKGRALANETYRATTTFPASELFGLTDQLRRASVSILANLAEGNGRFSPADQARCYRIALGSARETEALLTVAQDRAYIDPVKGERLLAAVQEVQRMLSGLLRYCNRRRPPHPPYP
jgi:four helix bundle protein